MAKELLVNVTRGEEVRVALVEDGQLEEIYLERDNAASSVGNIYLGKVTNVEGSIQAAFVDFGYGRNGFLHVQDLHPDHFPDGGRWENMEERVGKKIGRRDRPPIQDCLRRGDRIVVQIIKEGIGTKGPTLTSYPSIPGRFLVAMPGVGQMGVSKNIEDEKERRRLRKVLDGLEQPKDVGFIIRTAGEGKTKAELERDFKYLSRLWAEIDAKRKTAKAPALLYSEGDLVTRTVRDVWSGEVDRIVCDDVETAVRIRQFFKLLMPRTKVDVRLYEGRVPLFHASGIEREIETMFSRHVPLANGGSLVIDSTEAVVAIDVNTGKFREHGDAEETAFRMDLEAADEICRQLRLRDLGGLVICDFIDLRYSRHRQQLHDRLTEQFKRDRAKSRHLMMSEFGIVEMTRQRMRPDLKKSVFMPSPWSRGSGFIKTPESLALDVLRRLQVAAANDRVMRVCVRLHPTAAVKVLNLKRRALAEIERKENLPIEIVPDDKLAADAIEFDCYDDRDQNVVIESIKDREEEGVDQGGQRKRRRGGRGRTKKVENTGIDEAVELDEDGLVDLPKMKELGDLKLDEVEALAAEVSKKVEQDADPMREVLEALGRAEKDEAVIAAQEADDEDDEDNDKPKSRRGNRRGGRGRGSRDEVSTEAEASDAESVEATDDTGEEEASESTGRRRRRRRRRRGGEGADESTESGESIEETDDSSDDEDEAEATDESPPKRSRRRRGGRGRRSESGDDASSTQAEQPESDEDETSEASSTEEADDTPPRSRRRRGRGRGSRGAEEATAEAEAPLASDADDAETPSEDDEAPRGRRRRRRRGRGGDSGKSAEATPADSNDEPAEPSAESPSVDEEAPRGRGRRRRGGRGGSSGEAASEADSAVDSAPKEAAEPAAPKRKLVKAAPPVFGRNSEHSDTKPDAPIGRPTPVKVNGIHDDAEPDSETDETPEVADLPEVAEEARPKRTRRRRRGSKADADPVATEAEGPDAVVKDADEADAVDAEPEAEVEEAPEEPVKQPARRRRRSAGKVIKSRPAVVDAALPVAEPKAEAEPPVKKATKPAPRKKATPKVAKAKAEETEKPKPKRIRKKAVKKAAADDES